MIFVSRKGGWRRLWEALERGGIYAARERRAQPSRRHSPSFLGAHPRQLSNNKSTLLQNTARRLLFTVPGVVSLSLFHRDPFSFLLIISHTHTQCPHLQQQLALVLLHLRLLQLQTLTTSTTQSLKKTLQPGVTLFPQLASSLARNPTLPQTL